MWFISKLFSKNKKSAGEGKSQKMPEVQGGLNEEMLSEGAEIPTREDKDVLEVLEKDEEETEESAEEPAAPEIKKEEI